MTIFNPEEKKRILIGLKSSVVATRFMTIKYLSNIADSTPLEFNRLGLEDPVTMDEILAILQYMEASDEDKMVRNEAKDFLEKLRTLLGLKQKYFIPRCQKCFQKMTFGWLFCPHCGKKIEEWEVEIASCPSCSIKVDRNWEFCTNCGAKLKEKIPSSICTRCGRNIDQSWSLCPYCGKALK